MKNVPEIRFSGFTDAWEQRKVGEFALESSEKGNSGANAKKMTVKLHEKGVEEASKQIKGSDNTQYYIRRAGQFIYGKQNFFNGAIGIVPKKLDKYESTKDVPAFDIDDSVDVKWLYYCIARPEIYKPQEALCTGTGSKRFHVDNFYELSLFVPNIGEQIKIAEYFRNLDTLITLHQRKLDKLHNVKKSLLEKMFPRNGADVPEIRFSGFTYAWEQRKFSDLAQRESAVEVSSPDCPSVEYEDVIAEEGRLNKDIRLKETQKTGIKFDGTQVLYGKLRPYLHNWLNPDFTGIAVGDWWVLRPICIDKDYIYRLIQTKQFDEVANQSEGSKMPRADWNLISNTEFFVPISMEEQSKITQAFADLDNLITLHQRKLDKLKQFKSAMLDKMFI